MLKNRKSAPTRRKARQPSDLALKKFAYMHYQAHAEYGADVQIENLDKFVAWLTKPIALEKPKLEVVGGTAAAKGQR